MKMSTGKLVRWSGLITLLAGVFYMFAALLHPVGEDLAAINHPNWVPAHLVFWVSALLLLFGLMGLYARQAEKAKWLGLVGFVLAFMGTALVGGLLLMVATLIPVIAAEVPALIDRAMTPPDFALPIIALGFGLGFILFGVVTMRAGVLPRWSGFLLIVGTALSMAEGSPLGRMPEHVIVTIGRVIFGLGLAWMGYALWSAKRESAIQDEPAAADSAMRPRPAR
jgi:hypothetical protein